MTPSAPRDRRLSQVELATIDTSIRQLRQAIDLYATMFGDGIDDVIAALRTQALIGLHALSEARAAGILSADARAAITASAEAARGVRREVFGGQR